MDSITNTKMKIIKTAGGRSIFFVDRAKIYKKDASGKESELYNFYSYLADKPDLMRKFPKFYGVVDIEKNALEKLIAECPFSLYKRAKKIRDVNKLLCMENLCSYFNEKPWILDLKMATPRTTGKYHISRSHHEFSIHGIRSPNLHYDHKENRDLDYGSTDQVFQVLGGYFPNPGLIDKLIPEIEEINQIFKKYNFRYDCSLLVLHDTKNVIVRVIDCTFEKISHYESNSLKRIDFLIDLLYKLKKMYYLEE